MKIGENGFWAVNSQTPSATCENSGPILQKSVCKGLDIMLGCSRSPVYHLWTLG